MSPTQRTPKYICVLLSALASILLTSSSGHALMFISSTVYTPMYASDEYTGGLVTPVGDIFTNGYEPNSGVYQVAKFNFDFSFSTTSDTYGMASRTSPVYASNGDIYIGGQAEYIGNSDIWVGRFDTGLNFIASATFNGSPLPPDTANGIALDSSGDVYVTGMISADSSYGGTGWIGKYSPQLTLITSTTFVGPYISVASHAGVGNGYAISAGTGNYVYVMGQILNEDAFSEAYIGRYDQDLVLVSSVVFSLAVQDGEVIPSQGSIAQDSAGNVYTIIAFDPDGESDYSAQFTKFTSTLGIVSQSTLTWSEGGGYYHPAIAVSTTNHVYIADFPGSISIIEEYSTNLVFLSSVSVTDAGGSGLSTHGSDVVNFGVSIPDSTALYMARYRESP